MNGNLKITAAVGISFLIVLTAFSFYFGLYDSGILYGDETFPKKFKLFNFFDNSNDNINPKHVTVEFLKKIFGE